ncbi:MBL fold metallo-hydrolase [Bacteriovorax sp. PP10]|uniref:MBL fold metallo-hydrolase n=1 Tax=Bacteriovorax antarcticus TaxID=3088717 RepID=A0ABU5VXQ7_9BACT|nr:MBL fold metallo-hydrolase [Bacteriovorax sp. PP10]MEA9357844.1 MBL fold metallo-hydrolase [Bacteriovorax sp. PP10]
MEIEFLGAIEGVTGSMTLLSVPEGKLLIDCGMFQGEEENIKKNISPLHFNSKDIDAIILTHAHLDHSGFIPRLIKEGFRGSIYSTKPTMKLAQIIMLDSAKLIGHENNPLHSMYDLEDAVKASSFFKIKKYNEAFEVLGLQIELIPAGHILGAASVVIKGKKTIVFSGDLGRFDDPIIKEPSFCPEADMVVIESTYGGKNRSGDIEQELGRFLKLVKEGARVGIIASFAVARGQLLIAMISEYFTKYPEEKIRVVIDSPMMVSANKVYREFADSTRMPLVLNNALSEIEVIDNEREWVSLQKIDGPLVIISSSGMVSGGRIWRHLENWQRDSNAILFLPGYQGAGTAGRLLAEGKRIIFSEEGVKIHWHGEVMTSDAFSSHADQEELLYWLKDLKKETAIYLNHGEEKSKEILMKLLKEKKYTNVYIAGNEKVKLY